MNRRRNAIIALALVCALGIVGMLLSDGVPDALFFALAALPLCVGAARVFAMRGRASERD